VAKQWIFVIDFPFFAQIRDKMATLRFVPILPLNFSSPPRTALVCPIHLSDLNMSLAMALTFLQVKGYMKNIKMHPPEKSVLPPHKTSVLY